MLRRFSAPYVRGFVSGVARRTLVRIVLPPIAESITEGKVAKWLKVVGEAVSEDEPLCMIESDKATQPLRATKAGTLSAALVAEGQIVKVGQEVAQINETADAKRSIPQPRTPSAPPQPTEAPRPASSSPVNPMTGKLFNVVVPSIAESITEGKLVNWIKRVGDAVKEDEVMCQVESDKATQPLRAPKAGTVTEIMAEEGQTVKVGQTVAKISDTMSPFVPPLSAPPKMAPPPPKAAVPSATIPSAQPAAAAAPQQQQAPPPTQMMTSVANDPRVRSVKISTMRQRIADRLKASQNTFAMLTTFNEIDMTNLLNLREKYKEEFFKRHGVRLGLMSPFVKAVSVGLMEVPVLNAKWGNETIEYHDYVDVSVAVATPNGLIVPVIRDAQKLSLAEIEKKIEDFSKRGRDGTITLPEMIGGTFTISNGGTFGSWMGTPIINPPQSAILGMHAIKKKPWVNEKDEIVVRQIMAVAVTYDHRLIDGRDAATFLVKVKSILEDPVRLLFDLQTL